MRPPLARHAEGIEPRPRRFACVPDAARRSNERHAMRRDTVSKQRLRALVGAEIDGQESVSGTTRARTAKTRTYPTALERQRTSQKASNSRGEREARPARFELATSRSGGERSIH